MTETEDPVKKEEGSEEGEIGPSVKGKAKQAVKLPSKRNRKIHLVVTKKKRLLKEESLPRHIDDLRYACWSQSFTTGKMPKNYQNGQKQETLEPFAEDIDRPSLAEQTNECIGKPSIFGICTDLSTWYFSHYSKEIEED